VHAGTKVIAQNHVASPTGSVPAAAGHCQPMCMMPHPPGTERARRQKDGATQSSAVRRRSRGQRDQVFRRVREHPATLRSHDDVVLDPDPAPPREVYPRLDRHHHARLQRHVQPRRQRLPYPPAVGAYMQRTCAMCTTFAVFFLSQSSFPRITQKELELIVCCHFRPGRNPDPSRMIPSISTRNRPVYPRRGRGLRQGGDGISRRGHC